MSERPRVLLIGPKPTENVAGVSIAFQMLLDGFDKAGIPYESVDLSGGKRVKKAGSFNLSRAIVSVRVVLAAWSKLPKVDTIYLTIAASRLGFLRDALILWPAAMMRKRIVVHYHGGAFEDFYRAQPEPLKRFVAHTTGLATKIIALGESLKDQFRFVPNADKKVVVVPNGLPTDLAPEDRGPKRFSGDRPFRVLFLSNMIDSKGYPDVYEAARILAMEGRPVQVDFCGGFKETAIDGRAGMGENARQAFESRIREDGLQGSVTYHGLVRGEQKVQMLLQADAFCLPTQYPWEGQPISIIEAMAFAVPTIATKHRGIPEQIREGVEGLFVPFRDPEAIAQAIRTLIENPDQYEEMSAAARKRYEDAFSLDAHLRLMKSVIFDQSAPSRAVEALRETI